MKHLILGNGAAGVTAAQKLRELNKTDEITVICKDNFPAYAKIMLPDYIGGKISRDKIFIRSTDFYKSNNIDLILNSIVIKVDAQNKQVILKDEKILDFDTLLIAVGGTPFIPPFLGIEKQDIYILNTVSDAERIKENASNGGRTLIVGAGLTGIEVGFALKKLGMEVNIVDIGERLLPKQLDDYSSKIMEAEIIRQGITLLCGTSIEKISGTDKKKAHLSNGSEIGFDMLIVSIGNKPNIEIVKDSAIQCDKGILVDEFLKTSIENIYAAGDVAQSIIKVSDEFVSPYTWSSAMAQGKCAAFGMVGQPQKFSSSVAAQSTVQLRDIQFISMGMVSPMGEGYEILMKDDKENHIYKRITIKDNLIKGMVFIGDTSTANTISSMLRNETDISENKHLLLEDMQKIITQN